MPDPRAHDKVFAVRQNLGHTTKMSTGRGAQGRALAAAPTPPAGLRRRARRCTHTARAPSPARRRAEARRARRDC